MKRLRKSLETLLITSVGLLTACIQPVKSKNIERPAIVKSAESESQPSPEKPYVKIYAREFSSYNPISYHTRVDIKDNVLLGAIINGFDSFALTDQVQIFDKDKLDILVTDRAAKLGYDPQQLARLSIREAIELACKITAENLHYFGHFDRKPLELSRLKLEELLAKSEISAEGCRILEEALAEIRRAENHTDNLIAQIVSYSGDIVKLHGTDKLPAEEILQRRMGVVCRNYAIVNKVIFDAFKKMNSNLKNTYMPIYNIGGHAWNQVATVYSDNRGNLTLDVTFIDPTYLDTSGDIEGFNDSHFGTENNKFWTAVDLAFECMRNYRRFEDKKDSKL